MNKFIVLIMTVFVKNCWWNR